MNPDRSDDRDLENLREFSVEVHRRFTSPILALTFPLVALTLLLLGPVDRRGQAHKIGLAVMVIMMIQGLYLAAYNMARNHDGGLILMYILVFTPLFGALFMLSEYSENVRRAFLYKRSVKGVVA